VLGDPTAPKDDFATPAGCWNIRITPARWSFVTGRFPDVLLSGNHAQIALWRRQQSLRRTAMAPPDMPPIFAHKSDLAFLNQLHQETESQTTKVIHNE
jgi:tRNA (guanine37-N1)-methyltransferase